MGGSAGQIGRNSDEWVRFSLEDESLLNSQLDKTRERNANRRRLLPIMASLANRPLIVCCSVLALSPVPIAYSHD